MGGRPSAAFTPTTAARCSLAAVSSSRRSIGPSIRSSACGVRGRQQQVAMRLNNGRSDDDVPVGDRVLASLPYLLPIADGIGYSKYVRETRGGEGWQWVGSAGVCLCLDSRLMFKTPLAQVPGVLRAAAVRADLRDPQPLPRRL